MRRLELGAFTLRQAIIAFDRKSRRIRHANLAACEVLNFALDALRGQSIERVIPSASTAGFTPEPAIARLEDGRDIAIYAHIENLQNVDAGSPDLITLHFWPPHPVATIADDRYARLETLWQLVLEPGGSAGEVADAILREATTALGMEYGALGYRDGDEVVVEHILGDGSIRPGARIATMDTLAQLAMDYGGPLEIGDINPDSELAQHNMVRTYGLRSFVTLTFLANARTWVLSLSSRQPRPHELRKEESAYLKLLTDVFVRLLDRAQKERQLSHLAFYDALTDLPNRAATISRIGEMVSAARRNGERAALFFVDIDGFKDINDRIGHSGGDRVLSEIGRRMRETLRQNEYVGRIGGDEFAIVFPQFEHESELVEVAQRLVAAIEQPFSLEGLPGGISASIGIAIFPDDANSREELLAHADAAMYRAKGQPSLRYCWYNAELARELSARQDLETRLHAPDLERELLLCYQPIVRTGNGELIAVEALLRWLHPSQGLLAPKAFMEIAQASRLTSLIDSWVVGAAFAQTKRWDVGNARPTVHINVTNPTWDMLDVISDCIRAHEIDASFLAVEMGETAVAREFETSLAIARALRESGVRVGLDGFCSVGVPLKRLAMMPVDFVKLDRDLVAYLFSSASADAALEAAISLARTFGWQIIAEGVQNERQRSWLAEKGVDAIQGYGVAHPLTAVDFKNWLEHRLDRTASGAQHLLAPDVK